MTLPLWKSKTDGPRGDMKLNDQVVLQSLHEIPELSWVPWFCNRSQIFLYLEARLCVLMW